MRRIKTKNNYSLIIIIIVLIIFFISFIILLKFFNITINIKYSKNSYNKVKEISISNYENERNSLN